MKKILNFINFGFIKRFFVVLIVFAFFVFVSAISYVNAVSEDIADSVFRLHVIANSDSKEDQDLKYKVRDAVLEYMNNISAECSSKEEVIKLAYEHQNDFISVAEKVIKENGFDYNVKIEIGNFEFPTKYYGDISLPAGFYDALKIEIGEAKGQNWWCVMFPPLCFVDVTSGVVPDESKQIMQNNLSDEEYSLISDNESSDIKFNWIFQKHKLCKFIDSKRSLQFTTNYILA